MRNAVELKELAWRRLWTENWFGRLFGGGLLLGLCGSAMQIVLSGLLGRMNVQTWEDYGRAVMENRQTLTTPIPNLTNDFIFQATSSTVLQMFIGYIMAGIAAYGGAVILIKCLKNEENGWLGEAFGGFKDPFGMLWLYFRGWLICFCWGLLAGLPLGVAIGLSVVFVTHFAESHLVLTAAVVTILMSAGVGVLFAIGAIPFYRYRFLFLFKAEHPDWSAGACLRSCKAFMEGHKLESFRLDCSYWKPITMVLLLVMVAVTAILLAIPLKDNKMLAALMGLGGVLALFASIAGGIILSQYISVGQGFLYEDLKASQATEQNERNA